MRPDHHRLEAAPGATEAPPRSHTLTCDQTDAATPAADSTESSVRLMFHKWPPPRPRHSGRPMPCGGATAVWRVPGGRGGRVNRRLDRLARVVESLAAEGFFAGTYIQINNNTYIMEQIIVAGDKIDAHGSGNTVVNRSTVKNAFNKVKAAHSEEVAKALLDVEAAINKSGNKEAAENFDSFSDELAKPEPKKSLLKALWQGTLAALPTLDELPDVIAKISGLFA